MDPYLPAVKMNVAGEESFRLGGRKTQGAKPKRAAFRSACEAALAGLGVKFKATTASTSSTAVEVEKPKDPSIAKRLRSSTETKRQPMIPKGSFMCAHCALAKPPRSMVFDRPNQLVNHVRSKHMQEKTTKTGEK